MIPKGIDTARRCGAKTRRGSPCQQPARKGSTRCRTHGGNAPQVRAAAERRMTHDATVAAIEKYGTPRRVTALDALEGELHRTQGHVDWLADRIAENPDPGWLTIYQAERAHLARLSHQMVTANVAERRTVLAEQALDRLENALNGALRELGCDPEDPRVRAVLGRHLRLVADDDDARHDDASEPVTNYVDGSVTEPASPTDLRRHAVDF